MTKIRDRPGRSGLSRGARRTSLACLLSTRTSESRTRIASSERMTGTVVGYGMESTRGGGIRALYVLVNCARGARTNQRGFAAIEAIRSRPARRLYAYAAPVDYAVLSLGVLPPRWTGLTDPRDLVLPCI